MYNKFQRDLTVKKGLHSELLERQGKVSPIRNQTSPRKQLWCSVDLSPTQKPDPKEQAHKAKQ